MSRFWSLLTISTQQPWSKQHHPSPRLTQPFTYGFPASTVALHMNSTQSRQREPLKSKSDHVTPPFKPSQGFLNSHSPKPKFPAEASEARWSAPWLSLACSCSHILSLSLLLLIFSHKGIHATPPKHTPAAGTLPWLPETTFPWYLQVLLHHLLQVSAECNLQQAFSARSI